MAHISDLEASLEQQVRAQQETSDRLAKAEAVQETFESQREHLQRQVRDAQARAEQECAHLQSQVEAAEAKLTSACEQLERKETKARELEHQCE